MSEKGSYYAGVTGGYAKDALATIERRYFKRFPVDLPDDVEPSAEDLAAVDDALPEPEQEEPKKDELSPEEYEEAMKKLEARRELIVYRKGQIKRWMAYQYMKDHHLDAKEPTALNPFSVLLQQLTGASLRRPRQKTPANLWRKTHREQIEEEAKRRMHADASKKKLAPIRESVAKEMFAALSQEEKDKWSQTAKEEHNAELAKWKSDVEGPASTMPADRQQCIQGLTDFVQPILDGICAVTGWKASLLAGGPEPAHGGRLNMISVHSGTIRGDIKMHFGRSEQVRYQKFLVPMYGEFLQKCYTPEDCRARALPDTEGFECLPDLGMGTQDVNIDSIPLPSNVLSSDKGPEERGGSVHPNSVNSQTPLLRRSPTPHPDRPRSHPPSSTQPCDLANHPLPPVVLPAPYPTRSGDPTPDHPLRCPTSPAQPPDPANRPPSPGVSPAPSPTHSEGPTPHPDRPCNRPPSPPQPHGPANAPLSPVVSAAPSPARSERRVGPSSASVSQVNSATPALPSLNNSMPPPPPPELSTTPRMSSPPPPPHTLPPILQGDTNNVKNPRRQSQRRLAGAGPSASQHVNEPPAAISTPAKRHRDDDGDDEALPAPKRVRGKAPPNTLSPPATAVSQPSPKWLSNSLHLFRSENLGRQWVQLVDAWAAFELKGHPDDRLSSAHRPDVVGKWIQRGRSTTWRPSITDIKTYETQFNTWWTNLQPSWRVQDGEICQDFVDGDLECLRKPGVNGLQSVLAALLYWGIAVQGRPVAARRGWNAAVEDCHRIISLLCV